MAVPLPRVPEAGDPTVAGAAAGAVAAAGDPLPPAFLVPGFACSRSFSL